MRVRDRVGLNLSPLLLRVMLGSIFLWLGLAKVLGTFEVEGTNAAILANMGVIKPADAAKPPEKSSDKPATPSTSTIPSPAPSQPPENKPGALAPENSYHIRLASQTGGTPAAPTFRSADFPKPVKVRKLYTIALAIKGAAEPGATPDGAPRSSYWPAALAEGKWPVYFAWAGGVGETLVGIAMLLGLMTRVAACLAAVRMAAALWVTQFGPMIGSGDAVLGFLPAYDAFDIEKWRPLVVQFALMMSALALLFLGPGRASLDHAIFASPRQEDDDDDDAE